MKRMSTFDAARQKRISDHREEWNDRQSDKVDNRIAFEAARAGRTAAQQVAKLDFRLGKGAGAKKERARLAKAT